MTHDQEVLGLGLLDAGYKEAQRALLVALSEYAERYGPPDGAIIETTMPERFNVLTKIKGRVIGRYARIEYDGTVALYAQVTLMRRDGGRYIGRLPISVRVRPSEVP